MTVCRLCSQDRKLIKAHAIPEAFFRELRVDGETPLLISGKLGQFPERAPIGVYDEGILCEVCEPQLGKTDDYGIEVFLKKFDEYFHPLQRDDETAGFESVTADPSRLLQFLVAVLWRASVSSHRFYAKVKLGPYESLAHAAVSNPDAALPPVFDALLSRWSDEDEHIPTTAILDPRREKWSGVNAYRLYFGEIVAYIKVDSQPFPPGMSEISLRSAPPVRVVARDMSESKDLRAMKKTAQRSHENKTSFRNARSPR